MDVRFELELAPPLPLIQDGFSDRNIARGAGASLDRTNVVLRLERDQEKQSHVSTSSPCSQLYRILEMKLSALYED